MWNPPVGYVPSRLQLDRKPSWPPSSKFAPSYGAWRAAEQHQVLANSTVLAFATLVKSLRAENAAYREEVHDLTLRLASAQLESELHTFWQKEFKEARWAGNDTLLVVYTLRL
jgi:hypothetical protein